MDKEKMINLMVDRYEQFALPERTLLALINLGDRYSKAERIWRQQKGADTIPFTWEKVEYDLADPDDRAEIRSAERNLLSNLCKEERFNVFCLMEICVELLTDKGNLLIYGTIMGVSGNREASFNPDLEKQMGDIRRLSTENHSICVIGDYSLSFGDNYYYTKYGRNLVRQTSLDSGIDILTQAVPECIDHIAVSKGSREEVY